MALFRVSYFVPFVLLVVLHNSDKYAAVKIKVDPATFSEDEATEVVVKCTADDAEADAKAITLLKIARKGERAVVMIHQNNSITYAMGNKEEFPAKGFIYSDIKESNLEMTITKPDVEDAGAYICHAHYNTSSLEAKENKATGHLTVQAPEVKNLNNTIKRLLDKVEKDKEELKKIEKIEKEDKAKVENLEGKAEKQDKDIKSLVEKEAEVENKVKELEQKTEEQIKKVTEGIDKNPKVKKLKDQVQKLLDKVDSEEKDIKNLNKKKEEEDDQIQTLKNTVEQQAKTIADLSEKFSDLERKLENHKSETKKTINDLSGKQSDKSKSDVDDLKSKVREHAQKIPDLVEKVKKIKDMAQKVTELKGRLDRRDEESRTKTKTVADLKEKVSKFQQNLENHKADTKRKINDLSAKQNGNSNSDVDDLKSKVQEHAQKIPDLVEKVKKIREVAQKVTEIKGRLDRRDDEKKIKDINSGSSSDSSFVAFHATSSVDNMYPNNEQSLSFSQVTLNEGQAYNQGTGVFTAPKTGIYVFHLTLQVPCYGCKMEATIESNQKVLARFIGGYNYDHDQHSISAVAKLQQGGTVTAMASNVNNQQNSKFSLGFMQRCTFSGYLVATPSSSAPNPLINPIDRVI